MINLNEIEFVLNLIANRLSNIDFILLDYIKENDEIKSAEAVFIDTNGWVKFEEDCGKLEGMAEIALRTKYNISSEIWDNFEDPDFKYCELNLSITERC